MGYTVVADRSETDQMRTKYSPRNGLEGPFNFSGRVLYYDPVEGKYYGPRSDWYVEQEEMDIINTVFMERFKSI